MQASWTLQLHWHSFRTKLAITVLATWSPVLPTSRVVPQRFLLFSTFQVNHFMCAVGIRQKAPTQAWNYSSKTLPQSRSRCAARCCHNFDLRCRPNKEAITHCCTPIHRRRPLNIVAHHVKCDLPLVRRATNQLTTARRVSSLLRRSKQQRNMSTKATRTS